MSFDPTTIFNLTGTLDLSTYFSSFSTVDTGLFFGLLGLTLVAFIISLVVIIVCHVTTCVRLRSPLVGRGSEFEEERKCVFPTVCGAGFQVVVWIGAFIWGIWFTFVVFYHILRPLGSILTPMLFSFLVLLDETLEYDEMQLGLHAAMFATAGVSALLFLVPVFLCVLCSVVGMWGAARNHEEVESGKGQRSLCCYQCSLICCLVTGIVAGFSLFVPMGFAIYFSSDAAVAQVPEFQEYYYVASGVFGGAAILSFVFAFAAILPPLICACCLRCDNRNNIIGMGGDQVKGGKGVRDRRKPHYYTTTRTVEEYDDPYDPLANSTSNSSATGQPATEMRSWRDIAGLSSDPEPMGEPATEMKSWRDFAAPDEPADDPDSSDEVDGYNPGW